MAVDNEVYQFYNEKKRIIETTNEKKINEMIAEDIDGICDFLHIDEMGMDRNVIFKVHRLSFKDRNFGFWFMKIGKHVEFHSLGVLRLIFGKSDGTKLYLMKRNSEHQETNESTKIFNFFSIFRLSELYNSYVCGDEYRSSNFYNDMNDFIEEKVFDNFIKTLFTPKELMDLIEDKNLTDTDISKMIDHSENILKVSEILLDD